MGFIKYPSLINSYKEDLISISKETNCVVLEKLDGANVQFVFEPYKDVRFASRNQICSSDFYGMNEVIDRDCKDFIKHIQNYVDMYNINVNLYGELIGPKIQKRIYYGDIKSISFFDIMRDGRLLPFNQFIVMLECFYIPNYMWPIFINSGKYSDMAKIDNTFQSKFIPVDRENIAEGIVIKPIEFVQVNEYNEVCIVKSKNEKFTEVKRQKNNINQFDSSIKKLKDKFAGYINENRCLSYFSKAGTIESEKQIGMYIKEILEDAKNDFYLDLTEEENSVINEADQKEKKYIFNVGSSIANLLIGFLRGR